MALLATGFRTLFLSLACSIAAVFLWAFFTAGNPFRKEFFTLWMPAALVEFYINIFTLALWVAYKESSSLCSAIWIVVMCCTGSLGTCSYIFIQFLKLSPQESAQDPIYHVLLRPEHKSYEEQKGKNSSVIAARTVFTLLGCLLIATLIYSVKTDGSPFSKEVFSAQWLTTTMIDCYVLIVALLVWVVYTETSWFSASMWIVLFLCFASITTCGYVSLQLFRLGPQDPVHLVLIKHNNRTTKVPLLSSV